jgi:hypothetical protein
LLLQQQAKFDAFIEEFNNEHPHEATGALTPVGETQAFGLGDAYGRALAMDPLGRFLATKPLARLHHHELKGERCAAL